MLKYKYKTSDLCKRLGVSRMTLHTWEKKGFFTPPRVGSRGDRAFTKRQLHLIEMAFRPGGPMKWHFEPKSGSQESTE
jgi:hypothetical protein